MVAESHGQGTEGTLLVTGRAEAEVNALEVCRGGGADLLIAETIQISFFSGGVGVTEAVEVNHDDAMQESPLERTPFCVLVEVADGRGIVFEILILFNIYVKASRQNRDPVLSANLL